MMGPYDQQVCNQEKKEMWAVCLHGEISKEVLLEWKYQMEMSGVF